MVLKDLVVPVDLQKAAMGEKGQGRLTLRVGSHVYQRQEHFEPSGHS